MMSMNKDNPVALVTGASIGIGRATAKALQNVGFRVFGTSRRAASESADGVSMLTCDVTDDASVAKSVDEVLDTALASLPRDRRFDRENRREAVRRMIEFGERRKLSLGEPVTRQFLHEGHRI